jgi:hypothetical protein
LTDKTALAEHPDPQSVLKFMLPAGTAFGEFGVPLCLPSIRVIRDTPRINWELP